ncbi:MAG: glycosyltransferase family 2 protein, partial [Veillonella atypica]
MVSIVIPVYNTEKYLRHCIESVILQTYKDLEIILIDDGSTDNSAQMCDAFADIDKRVKVIHKENGGLSSARNTGMKIAHGKYIT